MNQPGKASQHEVAQRNLLESEVVARVQLDCSLEIAQSFFTLTAPTRNVSS